MKVGIVLPGFSASEADWCIPALLDLVRCLSSSSDAELHVYPLRYPPHRHSYAIFGARIHPLGGAETRGLARIPLLARAIRAIRQEHARAPFNILHAFWADEPGFVTAVCATMLHVPTIVSMAGGELARLPDISYGGQLNVANRLMTHVALRSATHVTAGSQFLHDLVCARAKARHLVRLPLGVDGTRFRPGVGQDSRAADASKCCVGPPRILSVASLVPVKDHISLLNAFAITVNSVPDARLHLVGDGPMRNALEAHAARLGVGNRVVFHGGVTHDQLPDHYRSADFCVLSSRFEAQGMVVVEAAACGTPTVGTRVGVIPEFNPDGAVAVGDVEGLAQQMIALARDRSRREQHASHVLSTVRGEFRLESTTKRLLDLYRDTLTGDERSEHDTF